MPIIHFNFRFNAWDYLLLVVLSLIGTLMAYLHHPKWKALIMSLPIPFTITVLSLGNNLDTTNVIGLLCLTLYTFGVWFLYVNWRMPIVLAIATVAASYAVVAILIVPMIPRSETAFYAWTVVMFLLMAVLRRLIKHRNEPGHRSPLPVLIKLPITIGIVLFVIISKKMLQGFMTMFPMLWLIASYEARHSLWTMCRVVPGYAIYSLPMMVVIHVAYPFFGLGVALALGWAFYLAFLIPSTLRHWRRIDEQTNGLPTEPIDYGITGSTT